MNINMIALTLTKIGYIYNVSAGKINGNKAMAPAGGNITYAFLNK